MPPFPPLHFRRIKSALVWGLGVASASALKGQDIAAPSADLGFGNPAFGAPAAPASQPSQAPATAGGFPTSPLSPELPSAAAPLPNAPGWDPTLDATPPASAPYLVPLHPQEILTTASPALPGDPPSDLTVTAPEFPDSIDASILDAAPPAEFETEAPNNRATDAGDFINPFSSSPLTTGDQISPSGLPSGFSQGPGNQPTAYGLGGTLLDGFGLAAFLSGTYDTNPSQGYTTPSGSSDGDFYMTLGGTAAYRSKASDWTYGALYNGSYNQYVNQSELSGYNQNAGASVSYQGGPFSAEFNLGVNFGSGANRYYAAVVDQISVNYGLSARYKLSPKTTATGNFSQTLTSASGNTSSDTGSFTAGVAGLWRYSARTEFGPGISYSQQSGSTQQNLTSVGPTLTVNYKLSSKVSLNSLVGLQFSQYADGQTTDPTTSANIGLNYRASALWGMNLAFFRNVRADPGTAGQFQEITSLRVGYTRKIRRAQLNLGASLQHDVSQAPDSVATLRPDSSYLNLDSSLTLPVFANTCNASIFASYSDQSGDSGFNSWDSLKTGFSISRSF